MESKSVFLPQPTFPSTYHSQYQFCLNKNTCTPLIPLTHNATLLSLPPPSSVQTALLQLLLDTAYNFNILTSLTADASKLIAVGGIIPSLPADQWIRELTHWEAHAYASLQIAVEKYATGAKSIDPFAGSYVVAPRTVGERELCQAVRVRKGGGVV